MQAMHWSVARIVLRNGLADVADITGEHVAEAAVDNTDRTYAPLVLPQSHVTAFQAEAGAYSSPPQWPSSTSR
ncbi:hypothetical protein ACFOOM_15000 [Streptomyces echinoruber]|nr:hypothetical protein [Streptomyces echinoruber]